MKKVLAISSMLLGVVFLAGCGQQSVSQTQPIAPAPVTQAPTVNQPAATQPSPASGITYTNTDFGFKIALPTGWEKYKPLVDNTRKTSFVHILIPTNDKEWTVFDPNTEKLIYGYVDMFAIEIWDLSRWNEALSSADCKDPHPGCPFESGVIAKNSKYVFVASTSQDYPFDDSAIMNLIHGLSNGPFGKSDRLNFFLKEEFELIAK